MSATKRVENAKVDAWLRTSRSAHKDLIAAVRQAVLAADPRITEDIRWKSPTFVYHGTFATFFPNSTSYICLLFHEGALIPGDYPSLLPESSQARTMRFRDLADLETKRAELARLVRSWCDMQDRVAA